jgi:hypothetical protein
MLSGMPLRIHDAADVEFPDNLIIDGEPRFTLAMEKHNHSSGDRAIQYDGKYSRHSRGQA